MTVAAVVIQAAIIGDMIPSECLPREELYHNWHAWVTASLGHNPKLAAIAANAATDAAVHGSGFNEAAKAATTAWADAVDVGRLGSKRATSPRRPRGGHALRIVRMGTSVLITVAIVAALLLIRHPGPFSRSQAITNASRTTGVHSVTRSDAKLMTWGDFKTTAAWVTPGVCCFTAPPSSQRVWVVALVGDIWLANDPNLRQRSTVVVLSASGDVIAFDSPDFTLGWPDDWPPYWDRLPDLSGAS